MGHIHVIDSYHGNIKYSYDKSYLINQVSDDSLYITNVYTKKRVLLTNPYYSDKRAWNNFREYDISLDGKYFISTGNFATDIGVWDVSSGKEIRLDFPHSNHLYSVAFSKSGKYIVTGDRDDNVKIWDFESGECIKTLEGHSNGVVGVSFYDNDEKIASWSYDQTLRFWDWRNGTELNKKRIINNNDGCVCTFSIRPDMKYICTTDRSNLYIWDYKTTTLIHTIPCKSVIETWWDNNTLYFCETSDKNHFTDPRDVKSYSLPNIDSFLREEFRKLNSYHLTPVEIQNYYLE